MTRHAKNCTAGAVYTYHEKKRDAQSSGYGTQSQRVGKDSIKDFDCCSLTLQPCREPLVSPEGHIFDKEAIYKYIITKKNEYSRKLKEYERQKKKEQSEVDALAEAEKQSKLNKFLKTEKNIVTEPVKAFISGPSSSKESTVSNMRAGKDKQLPSFWVPSMTPESKTSVASKPDKTIYCPITGSPLKSLIAKTERYKCPVTGDVLSNSIPCAVIRTTGDVVTMECVEKIIKKDWLHPITGDKLSEKDIIPLQRGGTGYATTNEKLKSKQDRPVLQA
ncbi:nitric oxide synthase-interacting protein homolog isoform X2 [Neocloeon triangulifer]|uniref:nitric oxide synthase-interacting protein homolog isoform X2 n=1 Tax=Neocloeon triangulifer TaxID=2078957 RepID=UPI00286F9BB6|nr:nitric oxide synthase-interacting protein homolog isoform X2 [Neocloeon triangulifer]